MGSFTFGGYLPHMIFHLLDHHASVHCYEKALVIVCEHLMHGRLRCYDNDVNLALPYVSRPQASNFVIGST